MFKEVFLFEIKYRFNRPATYIYFVLVLLLTLLAFGWKGGLQFGGDIGKIKQNASSVIYTISTIFSIIPLMFIASSVMGVPILRDFEHKMESLIFSTNINKSSYLLGRFSGSFVILLFISTGFIWGGLLGSLIGSSDRSRFLPITFGQFFNPWLDIMVFNLFVFSCLFFGIGALTRKMLFVYLQAIVLLAIYIVVTTLAGDPENFHKAALLDPFASYTVSAVIRYWTVAEKNTLTLPLSGVLLANRLIWTGVGLLLFNISFIAFKFRSVYTGFWKKRSFQKEKVALPDTLPIPFVRPVYDALTWARQVSVLTKLYFKEIFRSVPFIGIAFIGLVLIAMDAAYASSWYGQELYPLSSMIAEFIASEIMIVIVIMTLFYSGELIWKEKEIRFSQIYDTLPTSYAIPVVSKYLAMGAVILVYVLFLIPVGMLVQLGKGFSFIEPGVYFKILMLRVFVPMLVYTAITMFLQSLFSNKFTGYAVSISFYIYVLFANRMKIFENLLIPDSGSAGTYSDMNGFTAELQKFWTLKLFWFGICGLLLVIAVLAYQRGTDTGLPARLSNARRRFGRPQLAFTLLSLLIAIVAGSRYYQSTHEWNRYRDPEGDKDLQARYEKDLKQVYENVLQPSVVNVQGRVDLVPEKGNLRLNFTLTYKNLLRIPIAQLLIQEPDDDNLQYSHLNLSVHARLTKSYAAYRFKVYQLETPLQPGDSLVLQVKGERVQRGFINGSTNTSYVNNGTFINNFDILPWMGYARAFELSDTEDRKKRGLREQKGLPSRNDTTARQFNLFGQRGRTNLHLILSTAPGQTAICPGYLKRQWTENGRVCFEYQMDQPIFNFYNMMSGRYVIRRDKWQGVNLEIYYHKDHPFNLDIMMTSLKNGLTYNSKNFSPFLYRQMRIVEYPKYRGFAQSFPNTIPFSEGIGFVFRHEADKLDMCYYVTAHELAHQWWGHQVCEANTVGNQMFSESLAQYSAMMLLKRSLPVEELRRYLKYELDSYLSGRSSEKKNEHPLDQTDNQQYIHYQKGTLANFAMQDYIGEENMNQALRKLVVNYGNSDRYPTSDVLTSYIKEVTPDSLKYIVDDLYSKITLFENRVIGPTAKKVTGGYEVTIPVQTVKYYADQAGNEKPTPIRDYIDIGVFSLVKGREKLVYLKREKFTAERTTVRVLLKDKPERAGIDPVYKLVDRNTDDNTALVEMDKFK